MYAKLEPTGISVRRGAVQFRIDFFDENDSILHSHFIQVSPDVTDKGIQKIMEECLNNYQNNKSLKRTDYKPFDVLAPIEESCFVAIREGKTPQMVGEKMAKHLTRCAVKGLDVAARAEDFKVSR